MKIPVVLSWSGGKDCAMALYELSRRADYEVVALLTTVSEEFKRISHHGVREELLELQAEAIGIPLDKIYLPSSNSHPCTNAVYEQIMGEAMGRYKRQGAGATDWIPFSIATTPIGRGVSQSVSGPGGSLDVSQSGFANISFTYYGNGTGSTAISSGSTEIDVPAYTPLKATVSAPNAQNQVTVTLNGAYQVQPSGSGTYASVNLYSDGGSSGSDTLLAQNQLNDINPSGVSVYWTGLAISYSETVNLTLSGNTLTGPLGLAPWNDRLFQQLDQSTIGKLDSGDSYVPGS